jgi:hypothetical protein
MLHNMWLNIALFENELKRNHAGSKTCPAFSGRNPVGPPNEPGEMHLDDTAPAASGFAASVSQPPDARASKTRRLVRTRMPSLARHKDQSSCQSRWLILSNCAVCACRAALCRTISAARVLAAASSGARAVRRDRCGLFGATLEQVRREELKRGLADGRAEEPPYSCHIEKPARPPPRIAANLRVGQVAHGRQCLIAGG